MRNGKRLKRRGENEKLLGKFAFLIILYLILFPVQYGLTGLISCQNSSIATVYFFDVGQGDSIFIDTKGKDVLIDGGPAEAGATVMNYLSQLNVSKIDIVVATHPHEDHIGGLITILNSSITVDVVLYNNQTSTSKTYQKFMSLAKDKIVVANRSQVHILDYNVNFTVLNPIQPLEFDDVNSNSIVLRLQAGNVSFLFTGDATFDTEMSMMNAGLNLESQVLKVAHHGSKYSTSTEFIEAVNPTYAVISVGDNPYGHPSPETIQRLLDGGVTVYSTQESGTIIMSTDGQTITIHGNPEPIPELASNIFLTLISAISFLIPVLRKNKISLKY
ncbi:MBL fold metallo-hydrolase [Candidatus Bathyarchaeota archaeon]|nr:MAG: MBL fold metallo-hydrolase [Candidatus Bathyarchaeota archaeon]